jgi:opacity protein-like surface antigen
MVKKIFCFLLVSGVLISNATADDLDKKNYIILKPGLYSPQSDELDDFRNGLNFEAGYGRYITKYIAAEAFFSTFYTTAKFSGSDAVFGDFKEEDFISTTGANLALKGFAPLKFGELYAMGGAGIYFLGVDADVDGSLIDLDFADYTTKLGLFLGGGANFNITKRIFLGVEGKYLWLETEFKDTVAGVPFELDADMQGFTISGVIGFRF